jgi:hypothetical protein
LCNKVLHGNNPVLAKAMVVAVRGVVVDSLLAKTTQGHTDVILVD